MTNTISITSKDGQVWNINRSILKHFADKTETEIEAFFARFFAWFKPWERDVLKTLIRMERSGIAIDDTLNLKYNK